MKERQKFTTILNKDTIQQLETIRIDMNYKTGNRIRGLNTIIEIIVKEKWDEIKNGEDNKKK